MLARIHHEQEHQKSRIPQEELIRILWIVDEVLSSRPIMKGDEDYIISLPPKQYTRNFF